MAAVAAAADEPILLRLHEQAPTLLRSAGPDEVVMHRLQLRQKAYELGIQDYVVGITTLANPIPHLPPGASNANKTIGKRWLLSAFEDNNLRGMVAQHGGDSGPSCWNWIGQNLLGGREEQEVLSYLLNQLRYDGSRTVMSFFSEFHTLASAIVPAIPDGRLCTMYASKFPAREYISIVSACDTTPGHGNFMNFANAVNAAIQRWHQRLLNERRDGHETLVTTFDRDDADEFEAYMTDSTTFHRPDDPPFTYNEVDDMADQFYQAIDLYLVRKGNGPSRGGNHGRRPPQHLPRPPQSPRPHDRRPPPSPSNRQAKPSSVTIQGECTNCGKRGHRSKDCPSPDAKCGACLSRIARIVGSLQPN